MAQPAPTLRAVLAAALFASVMPAHAGEPTLEVVGPPVVVFDQARDGCAPDDMPDVNPRAFRDAAGDSVVYALHDSNRPLRGPDLAHLKLDCHVPLASPEDADPARYADRNFIAATWTRDGRAVDALVHHEYHADHHGRCAASGDLACWYNTVLAYRGDGARGDFTRQTPLVVAAPPFKQESGQGRQRGFFNPSNIVSDGRYRYAMISTTGWAGQPDGACLFRAPVDIGAWRADDGTAFTIRYADPYAGATARPRPCRTLAPFSGPVGSLTFHRASRTWIAVFQAKAGAAMPLSGVYYAFSRDLVHWGAPRILLASPTLYDDPCRAGPTIVNYPALLDAASPSRNYDEVGDAPDLWFTIIELSDCRTAKRLLVRRRLAITAGTRP